MKAKNNREVIRAILRFSASLLASVALATGMYAAFIKTSDVEVQGILEKSGRYDQLQMKQAILTESVDSLYHYSMLVNSDNVIINRSLMLNVLSTRSILFNEELSTMSEENCLIYRRLSAKMGGLLLLKDSIRTANLQLDVLRDEYVRCMNKNRDMTRRLFTGSVY